VLFSFFRNGGIRNAIPTDHSSIDRYIEIVRNNPERDLVLEIRKLRLAGNESYIVRKESASYCTPSCQLKYKKLSNHHFRQNFIQYSGYFYFDFDLVFEDQLNDVKAFKQYFIEKYGDYVTTVALSISGGGISVLLKVPIEINSTEEYNKAWNVIRNTIFNTESVDSKVCDLGRALYLTDDPDIYVNLDNEIDFNSLIDDQIYQESDRTSKETSKNVKVSLFTNKETNNRLVFTLYGFNEFMKVLKLKTQVEVLNEIVDFKEIEFVEVTFPRIIVDGRKRKAFSGIIHHLIYLNPNIDPSYIYSYLVYINNNFTAYPKMEKSNLEHLVRTTINNIHETGEIYIKTRYRRVHFNPNANLHPTNKSSIANQINGRYREFKMGEIILKAKNELLKHKEKFTKAELRRIVALEIPKISRPTINKYFDYQPFSFDDYIYEINQLDFNKSENMVHDLKTHPDAFKTIDWLEVGGWV
jgi:hypothetical protein